MSRIPAIVGCVCITLGACATPPVDSAEQCLTIAGGKAGIGSDGWSGYDDRPLVALGWSTRKPDAAVGIETAVLFTHSESKANSAETGADFFDLRVGATRSWSPIERLSFVGGVGVRGALARVDFVGTYAPTSESGGSIGVYAHAGAFCRVAGNFSIGVDAQWADGSDYSIDGQARDAQMSMVLLALRWDL